MTLPALLARTNARILMARPVWLTGAIVLFTAISYGAYRLVKYGVEWLYAFPLITTIAPAVTQRSLEGFFLMLMAAVLFSVLIASIGTLYGADDLEFLLAQPESATRVFSLKILELFTNAAGLPLAFTLPVLIGVGAALDAHWLYYPVSVLASVALYALPVTLGALLALVLVRVSPAGRVREVATAVSISAAAAALLGLRALRPEQLTQITAADSEAFEAFLSAFARLEIGWMPPAWATNASWAAVDGRFHPSLAALILVGAAGLILAGFLAHTAFTRGWVRSLDAAPAPRPRPAKPAPTWERFLANRLGVVGAILAKDARIFTRDVQQWSQILVLLALGGVYFLSLSSIPIPTQQFKNVIGALNIAFVGFLITGVALRIAYPGVSYEGRTYWLTQIQPIRKRDLVIAKYLFALPLILALAAGLGVAATRLLEVSPTLALAAPLAAVCSAIAMTGLAVGLGAAHPRFSFTNPNELAMTPGAISFMAIGLAYSAALTYLLARPAWTAINNPNITNYWQSPEGLLVLAAVIGLTLLITLVPLWHGARQLHLAQANA